MKLVSTVKLQKAKTRAENNIDCILKHRLIHHLGIIRRDLIAAPCKCIPALAPDRIDHRVLQFPAVFQLYVSDGQLHVKKVRYLVTSLSECRLLPEKGNYTRPAKALGRSGYAQLYF